MDLLDEHLASDGKGKFAVFHRTNHQEELERILELFKENGIPYRSKQKREVMNSIITGQSLDAKYWVEIQNTDFPKAQLLLSSLAQDAVEEEDLKDHYLNELDDGELWQVLLKPDEWNHEAVAAAKMILKKRGVELDNEELAEKLEKRNREIKKSREGNPFAMAIYFALGLISGYFGILLGALVSAAMGFYYSSYKSVAPDGDKYFEFGKNTRVYGWVLLILSIIIFVLGRVFKANSMVI